MQTEEISSGTNFKVLFFAERASEIALFIFIASCLLGAVNCAEVLKKNVRSGR